MTPTSRENQMPPDIRDEDLMRRFLTGDVTVDERERVEDAFAGDATYFEDLAAFESEMIARYVRGELPAAWLERFESTLPSYPERQRQIAETRRLRRALDASPEARAWSVWFSVPFMRMAAATASIAVVIAGGWWLVTERRSGNTLPPAVPAPATSVTFTLVAGQTRSNLRQANVFRIPEGIQEVRLALAIPAGTPAVTATLRQVGGGTETSLDEPERRQSSSGETTVVWRVKAATLVLGDYLLTVRTERSIGVRDVAATAFFSITE
jgi:hypothetical protein